MIVMDPQIQPQELECLLENEVKKEMENRYYILYNSDMVI